MPVILTGSKCAGRAKSYDAWCVVDGAPDGLDPDLKTSGLGLKLERAFDTEGRVWWEIATNFGLESNTAELSHTATCNSNVSDFGAMLAWTAIILDWHRADTVTIVVCDDPWLRRHFAETLKLPVPPGQSLHLREWILLVRGYLVRVSYAVSAFFASIRLRGHRKSPQYGNNAIITYGHRASTANGFDAYFGDLLDWNPKIMRLLHVDTNVGRAHELATKGRALSLHAWGSPLVALGLAFKRWRPLVRPRFAANYWLIRRAAALEAGTGTAAAIAWQIHCQERCLADLRPGLVLWPWENHSWERALVRRAKLLSVFTIGYQHTVVGRRHWVHAVTNSDGEASLPDQVICSGLAWKVALETYGVPSDRLMIGGALRFSQGPRLRLDPSGPVFVALPFVHEICKQMIAAIELIARKEQMNFVVGEHPMNPFAFIPTSRIQRSENRLTGRNGFSAVLYTATTMGLEAMISGLPVVRFVPERVVSVDIIPEPLQVPAADASDLERALRIAISSEPVELEADDFFAPAVPDDWIKHTVGSG